MLGKKKMVRQKEDENPPSFPLLSPQSVLALLWLGWYSTVVEARMDMLNSAIFCLRLDPVNFLGGWQKDTQKC